jgi:hypothetical protein
MAPLGIKGPGAGSGAIVCLITFLTFTSSSDAGLKMFINPAPQFNRFEPF